MSHFNILLDSIARKMLINLLCSKLPDEIRENEISKLKRVCTQHGMGIYSVTLGNH